MSNTNNPRSFRSNRDHALQAQLEAGALESTVGRVVEYVKENHVAPILADVHASKRQKTTARAEINMLNTLQSDITTVLKDVTNAQAKNSGISNAAYAASAQSRLQNQTRFPCDMMASKSFSQTKKDLQELQELQERSRNRSSRSGTQGASSNRKASVADPSSSSATSGGPSTTDPTPLQLEYPKPKREGDFYERLEVVEILASESNTRQRGKMLRDMLAKKLLPPQCSYTSIRKAVERYRRKQPINPEWGSCRPAKIPTGILLSETEKIVGQTGRAVTKKDLKEIAEKEMKAKAAREGNAIVDISISAKTLQRNAVSLVALNENVRFAGKTSIKTSSRFTAENSAMAAMSLKLTVAATHFNPDRDANFDRNIYPHLPEGSQNFIKEIEGALGHRVHPKLPWQIMNYDDTVDPYSIRDLEELLNDNTAAVSVETKRQANLHSQYITGQDNKMNIVRFKVGTCVTAGGQMAPDFITVNNLSARELPKGHDQDAYNSSDGIYLVEFKGLGVGGTLYPGSSGASVFVLHVREDIHNLDYVRAEIYFKNILPKFLEELRKLHIPGYEPGMILSESQKSIFWMDGHSPQVKAMLTPNENGERVDEMNGLVVNKSNGGGTGVQQALDTGPVFKHRKQQGRLVRPQTNHAQTNIALNIVDSTYAKTPIVLQTKTKKITRQYLASLPIVMQHVATTAKIQRGFLENGMLDSIQKAAPNGDQILKTCRRGLSVEELETARNAFPSLLKIQLKDGHISDQDYIQHGFKKDVNMDGEEVVKTAGISNEGCQRAKTLNHAVQNQAREDHWNSAKQKAIEQESREPSAVQRILALNGVCEERMKTYQRKNNKEETIQGATLQDFNAAKKDELKSFIHARKFPTSKVTDDSLKSLKKGKPADCSGEADSLLLRAFNTRASAIILKMPATTEDNATEELPPNPIPPTLNQSQLESKRASDYLDDVDWCLNVDMAFNDHETFDPAVVATPEQKTTANQLAQRMVMRLRSQMPSRLESEEAANHFTLHFAESNYGRIAAIVVRYGMAVSDIPSTDPINATLFKPSKLLKKNESNQNHTGAYVFVHDEVKAIRSGMVGARGFQARFEEHRKSASDLSKENNNNSQFYREYPSKACPASFIPKPPIRKGWFEDLEMKIALSFDPTSQNANPLFQHDAILNWPSSKIREKVQQKGKDCPANIRNAQCQLVAYLLENFFDMMISVRDNVSNSPGFESFGLSLLDGSVAAQNR